METGIHNTSEIGRLKKVLLHRPGAELENLMPEYLERLLFDDIPYLKEAQREHDAFADCLRNQGVEVVYLTDLVVGSLTSPEVRQDLIRQFLDEAGTLDERTRGLLADYFGGMSDKEMVSAMMAGVRKGQLRVTGGKLGDYLSAAGDDYPFAVDPLPNLYFTRDPFATIGTGVSIHKMHTATRNRETLFGKFIFEHHPEYRNAPRWYDRGETSSLEGGDILVLSPQVLAVGISQRTQEDSIDALAETVLSQSKTFRKILAFNIPKTRSFMHLDTVFTMVDRDKFTVHPNILGQLTVFVMELDENRRVKIRQEDGRLEDILKEHLNLDRVTLIPCGEGSEIDAAREQWSDGSNTLAIGAGEVVVYSRNYVTNRSLEEAGIRIHTIPSAELSRGRGGPRCMSMPLWREDP
ncbi:arginine deiminase [Dysosmobacter sp. NSJ-60]|uniref:Arginine deiminase n=1 Tax=Pusillibacter faecalis TaxID=2714358 RepID=A0A810QD75_9FIRM|nr:arginine deiminase [Pusillibacter faecalis]MBC5747694.1 arginine deiminase [Dysosmobacter hominis]MBS5657326.1 arginine deiminase [Oscillibacter sp.]BCK84197.1 arginine deiminase [Pusillibacter faecalis]